MQLKEGFKKALIVVSALALISLGLFIFTDFFSSHSEASPTAETQEISKELPDSIKEVSRFKKAAEAPQTEEEFITQNLKQELDWVANVYEQQSKYPLTSRVIQDESLARTPEPFEEARVDMRLPDENGDLSPIGLSASVDKIRYFMGDPIIIQLLITGTEGNESISVNANLKKLGNANLLPADVALTSFDGNQTAFQTIVNTNTLRLAPSSHELVAMIKVKIDEKDYVTTVPFIFSQASARLDNVAISTQAGAYLNIPIEYSVFQSGYYFVTAFLDDAASGRPLLALQTEGPMSQGNDRLVLKAHHQALKDAGSPGPYVLRVARSYRGGRPGEGNDVPTAISQSAYAIPAFAFENYDDIPYSDPEVQERLEALRSLTGE